MRMPSLNQVLYLSLKFEELKYGIRERFVMI